MMNRTELNDITNTYQEMVEILIAIDAKFDAFDAFKTCHNGEEIEVCPSIIVKSPKGFEVIFEFDFYGRNGYYYFK